MIIAIDGPSAAGKSTIAKLLAKELGFIYIDTGAMYRAVALEATRRGIHADDAEAVGKALDGTEIEVLLDAGAGEQKIVLNGEDVTRALRSPEMSKIASDVSRLPEVRLKMANQQRRLAEGKDVILDGRDIGTYVFPNAEKKFFLTASAGERARRRFLEFRAKDINVTYDNCLAAINVRDESDSARILAPLTIADDAIIIQTDSALTAREAAGLLKSYIDKDGV